MASDDPIKSYLKLGPVDRWVVERLLSRSDRLLLQQRTRVVRYANERERRRAEDPAALLKCNPALAKHLVSVALAAEPKTVTAKTQMAVRATIERLTAAP